MPIYEQTYKRWEGQLYPRGTRWLVIAEDSLRRSFKGKATKVVLLVGLIPFLVWTARIYIAVNVESLVQYFPFLRGELRDVVSRIDNRFYHDFLWSELPLALLVMFICGCNCIAEDRRTNALSLYLSRALTKVDYLFGKGAGVAVPLSCLTLIPGVSLYILHALFRNDLSLIVRDWRILQAIVAQSFLVIFPGTLLILAISSTTKQARYAAFGFIAIILGGGILQGILRVSLRGTILRSTLGSPKTQLISLYRDWECLGNALFEVRQPDGFSWPWALLGIGVFSLVSIWILSRQIRGIDIVE